MFAGAREPLPWRRMLVDTLVLTVLVIAAGLVFAPAYGGVAFLRALATGAGVGALSALVPRLLRWPAITSFVLVAMGYFGFGAAAAVPESAIGSVLPTGGSIRLLAAGVITSWKQMLTVAVPVGDGGALLVPVYLLAAALSLAAVLLAVRTSRGLIALVPAAAMAVGAAVLASSSAFEPAIVGTGWMVLAVLWASWRRAATGLPGLDVRRPFALLLVIVPTVAAGVLLGPLVTSQTSPRTIARELVQPPFDPSTLASPLSSYRRYVVTNREKPQLTVTGLPAGMPLRLAVLDTYSGQYYSTSADVGTFARVGGRLAQVPSGTSVTVGITVDEYADVWVPDVGYLAAVGFGGPDAVRLREDFRYNRETGAAVVTSGLRTGDRLELTASVPAQPTPQQLGDTPVDTVAQDPLDKSIPEVVSKAGEWGGSGSPAQVVENLRKALHDTGYVSHGETESGVPGGHGADRIRQLLTSKIMRGDSEQYAVALALMVRAKGYPARVVLGFRGGDAGDASQVIDGSRLTAWVEVPFVGYGWVAFDPLPDEQKPPPTQRPDENQSQADPQQAQPPPPPVPPQQAQADAQDDTDSPDDPQQDDQQQEAPPPPDGGSAIWGWVALGVGIPVLLLVPFLVILLLKRRRRRALSGTGTPDQRIAGGWRYLLGRAVDLGITPPRGTTRTEAARQLATDFAARAAAPRPNRPGELPQAPTAGGVAVLARSADAGIFAPEPVDPASAARYWQHLEQELAEIDRSLSPWRRWRARLSTRSLRKDVR
ncbi:MAG: transglutaminaseTgpA domain-containing protein [Nakamurella sp.]